MSEFTRLAGIEPLYKYDLDPKVDMEKAREAARVEMERIRKEKEHQSVLDDRTKVLSGMKEPEQAGILDVPEEPEAAQENLDMARPADPKDVPFAGVESRSRSLAAKRAFVKKVQAKYGRKMPGFDPEDYPKIRGMEGPFYMKTKGGRHVLYYDPKEGEYYDRKSDMYFPADQLESLEESFTLGDVWVQTFKTQKPIYFFPLSRAKNGNFKGLMYDPNFSRKAKLTSVPKLNAPKGSRRLWKVEPGVPMAAKMAFMDHPKYQKAEAANESVQRIAKFNESDSKRYEIVVNGKLHKTSAKPAIAKVLARRQKGSVQVVDSKTGDLLYDSELQKKPVRTRKPRISSMQRLRLNRHQTDQNLKKAASKGHK